MIPICVAGSRAGFFSLDVPTAAVIFGAITLVKEAVGLWWLHGAWSSVPFTERRLSDGRPVTPGNAVGRMFIPFYGFYWMFVANTSLCRAIDRVLLSGGRGKGTDASIAQLAAAGELIIMMGRGLPPMVVIGAAAVVDGLWFFYMYQTDRALESVREVVRRA